MAMALRAMRGASGPRARTGAIGWKVGCRGRGAFGTDRRRNARTAAAEGNGGRTDLPGEDVVFESEKLALQVRELVSSRLASSVTAGEATSDATSSIDRSEAEDVRAKLAGALARLESGLVERGQEARLVLLSACCGEHLLLIGPPGTAKSEVARRLGSIVSDDAAFFQRVLTRFSVPEELFGPLSLRALEEDVYKRNTAGYLPEAQVAFIDEVFKANSAVLNALLMILNEKRFDNGNEQVKVPLVCLVGASNELPQDPELQALYDRFLFRKMVNPVSDAGISNLLSSTPAEASSRATASSATAKLETAWLQDLADKARSEIAVPDKVIDILARLRSHLMNECEPPIYISDRRLLKCVGMLKMSAYTNGRAEVSEFDCLLLKHVCWSSPDEQDKVNDWIVDQLVSQTETKQLRYLLLGVFTRCCKAMGNGAGAAGEDGGVASDIEEIVEILAGKLSSMRMQRDAVSGLLLENVWLCREEAEVVLEQLQNPLDKSIAQVESLLEDALTVEACYGESVPLYAVADLLPEYWSDFIRKGDIEDVKPLGIKPLGK